MNTSKRKANDYSILFTDKTTINHRHYSNSDYTPLSAEIQT